jgi:hypothetical protein
MKPDAILPDCTGVSTINLDFLKGGFAGSSGDSAHGEVDFAGRKVEFESSIGESECLSGEFERSTVGFDT